jgi:hypothetical protein
MAGLVLANLAAHFELGAAYCRCSVLLRRAEDGLDRLVDHDS